MNAPNATPHVERFAAHGLSLTADRYGDPADPPVLLWHGGGQTRHAWGTAARTLAANGRCAVTYDMRGHGDSDWSPDGRYGIDLFAADVRTVAQSFSRSPTLVGASLGGLASLVAVAESPEPIAAALVLVDVTPRVEPDGASRIRDFMASGREGFASLEDAADAIAAFNPHRPRPKDLSGLHKNLREGEDGRWYWHWDPRFISGPAVATQPRGMVDHARLVAAARAVTIPTLLVRGMMSEIVSEESVREFRELIPHAEVVEVQDAGHMVAGDKNDRFNEAIIGFIDRNAPDTR
ncbi:MAG: alpha/beta fold hydrolase [Pseudomonadota bacterium]